jgi:hypothetical protein
LLRRTELQFSLWLERLKDQKKEEKNVFGVKILKEYMSEEKEKVHGSHCEVMMGRFLLIVMASINASTNKALEELSYGKVIKYEKEL